MSDDDKSVNIVSDQGIESIGKNAYLEAWDRRGFMSSSIVAIALIAIVFVCMMLSARKKPFTLVAKEMPQPELTRSDPIVGPLLLTSKDINVIASPRGKSAPPGKIQIISLRSISQLPVGSEIKAILESGASDGIVKARITKPVVVDGEQVLPENAILFGKGRSGEERLLVEFSKVIFPSGDAFSIIAQAFDQGDRILGLKGAVVGTRTKKMASAIAFGLVGGMAGGLQNTSGSSPFFQSKPSVRDAALGGASKAALDQSEAYIEEMKRSPNIIEVKAQTELIAIVDEPQQKEK